MVHLDLVELPMKKLLFTPHAYIPVFNELVLVVIELVELDLVELELVGCPMVI